MALSEEKDMLRSLVPEVTSHEELYKSIGYALDNQHNFSRRYITLYDADNWKPMKKFKIDLNKIDRIYSLKRDNTVEWDCDYRCFIYCRVSFENSFYYVHMHAAVDTLHRFCCLICSTGLINFTKSPIYFFQYVISRDFNILTQEKILKSLNDEGSRIPLLDSEFHVRPSKHKNAAGLQLLCTEAIYSSRALLLKYKYELPPLPTRSMTEYVDYRSWDKWDQKYKCPKCC